MSEMQPPSRADIEKLLFDDNNWSRWGADDQVGAVNLITPQKRLAALQLPRSGRTVSLSRPLPTLPARDNPRPVQHFMDRRDREGSSEAGLAMDYLGVFCHGLGTTHIDALCHAWGRRGMWNGRDPDDAITFRGVKWGGIEQWRDGIITRGVLLDIPRFRQRPYVDQDKPVHADELYRVAEAQGVEVQSGDALVVYCGRDAWVSDHDHYGTLEANGRLGDRPGLHPSCLMALKEWDPALLVWDMMDCVPNGYDLPFSVHGAIFALGTALVDNASLVELADACEQERRWDFMISIMPLDLRGGTGSPVNPVAVF